MCPDFFETQESARQATGSLIFHFTMGVITIVIMVCVAVAMGLTMLMVVYPPLYNTWIIQDMNFVLVGVALATVGLILGGMYAKIRELRAGGGALVAERLGGRRVMPGTTDPAERRLLNVVEEMALASGMPVPMVFIMEAEPGVNAFSAGWEPFYAVLSVTHGALDILTRDELQGVIAHEFSHIVNDDIKLNTRIMGIVHGIMLIGIIGTRLLTSSMGTSDGTRDRVRFFLPGMVGGFLLMIIGYGGTFFGQLIQAAVSRQREFLADAAAVQFTRYPDGLAGALKKIGGFVKGSRLVTAEAATACHMFFSQGVDTFLRSLLATHPPLTERIRRLDPLWDAPFPEVTQATLAAVASEALAEVAGFATLSRGPDRPQPKVAPAQPPGQPLAQVHENRTSLTQTRTDPPSTGEPTMSDLTMTPSNADQPASREQSYLDHVRTLTRAMHPDLQAAARRPGTAQAVFFALIASLDPKGQQLALDALLDRVDIETFDLVQSLLPHLEAMSPQARLPLVDMTLPVLREMTPEAYKAFSATVEALIRADKRVSRFEWTLRHILRRHVAPVFSPERMAFPQHFSLEPVAKECALLLSALALFGNATPEHRERAFAAGAGTLPLPGLKLLPREVCTLKAVDEALMVLDRVTPNAKLDLITACAASICGNETVSEVEGELLRTYADALNCPMPPLLPGQPLTLE